jgi:hypothetical protein
MFIFTCLFQTLVSKSTLTGPNLFTLTCDESGKVRPSKGLKCSEKWSSAVGDRLQLKQNDLLVFSVGPVLKVVSNEQCCSSERSSVLIEMFHTLCSRFLTFFIYF